MTNKMIELFRNAGLVNSENDQIILLGVRRICGVLTDLVIAMLWSLVLGDIVVGVLFEICYSVLRIYAGGYHASSERMCKWLTYTSTLISILMVFVMDMNRTVMHCLLAVFLCLIGLNVPIENENKPLGKREKRVYQRYCIVISIFETGFYFLFISMDMTIYARTVWIAILLVVIGIIIGKRKQQVR